MKNAFRIGERLYLRPLEVDDLEVVQPWMNDPGIHAFLNRFRPLNRTEEKEWLENLHKQEGNTCFGIALKEGHALIGNCGLRAGFAPNRDAELGIAIGDGRYHGKGHGTEAIGLLLDYGFRALNLHRIALSVFANNPRGIACYEKCGFRREGARREARWWDGRWWDILEYGILDREWLERTPREVAK